MNYVNATKESLEKERALLQKEYDGIVALGLNLDLSRGKPCAEQLELSMPMLSHSRLSEKDCITESGFDCRNYGLGLGTPEMRRFWSELTGIPAEQIIVGGNSSLNLMYDSVARAMLYGVYGSLRPWSKEERVTFLCPSPGYDRHFAICESLGIHMIAIPMTAEGPDMDIVERYAREDASVKGIWCVPKYSNPTGITYSDEVVRRLVRMETAAPDFRIYWDNAYMIHDLGEESDKLLDIFPEAYAVGNEDRVMFFTSSSKITFPGSGVAMMAMSQHNLDQIIPIWNTQTIGHDKLNQLRHLEFFTHTSDVYDLMKKHASILRQRFSVVLDTLKADLGDTGIATWNEPKGGYFVSLDVLDGCAQRVYALCKDAGVALTKAGATFPYGKDPHDKNLRLAPSYPSVEDLTKAMKVLTVAVRLAALEKLLEA